MYSNLMPGIRESDLPGDGIEAEWYDNVIAALEDDTKELMNENPHYDKQADLIIENYNFSDDPDFVACAVDRHIIGLYEDE